MFERSLNAELVKRLSGKRRFIQVLAGPRQVGKTTSVLQVLEAIDLPSHYASADDPGLRSHVWIEAQWETARDTADRGRPVVLVLDEVQKVTSWSEVVKKLWDQDTRTGTDVRVAILGSSPLLMETGLSESLAGRFETTRATHWSYEECNAAFGWSPDEFVFFGGYPGAAPLINDLDRWRSYIIDSLIETTISRDILLMSRVDKPALLRRLFYLGCEYSGQILSYQKMVGQLQDVGNTTTLAHYLSLLSGAGLISGLSKYAGQKVRRRGSSPKLQVLNTALVSALSYRSFEEARSDREWWGRLLESAVGAHLANTSVSGDIGLFYWREGVREVDFVLEHRGRLAAIEVKSGRAAHAVSGTEAFVRRFGPARSILIGVDAITPEAFFSRPADAWMRR